MTLLGFFLLLSGWGVVLASLILLGTERQSTIFIVAGFAIQVLGFLLVLRAQTPRIAGKS